MIAGVGLRALRGVPPPSPSFRSLVGGVRAAAAGRPPDQSPSSDPPPPELAGPFVRPAPLISYERRAACRRCGGAAQVPCGGCGGSGRLPAGGYHARNPVNASRVVGSAWTAMERTLGWRHFRVTAKRRQGKDAFVLMVATCDETVSMWVNIKNLKDRGAWAAGWLQRAELRALEERAGGAECKACRGTGRVPCPLCELAGQVVEL